MKRGFFVSPLTFPPWYLSPFFDWGPVLYPSSVEVFCSFSTWCGSSVGTSMWEMFSFFPGELVHHVFELSKEFLRTHHFSMFKPPFLWEENPRDSVLGVVPKRRPCVWRVLF